MCQIAGNSCLNQGCRRCSHTISCSFSPNASSGVDLDKKLLKKDHDLLKKTDIRPLCHRIQTCLGSSHFPASIGSAVQVRSVQIEHEGRRLPGGGVGRAGRAVVVLVGGGVSDEGRRVRHGRPRRSCIAARRAQMGRHRRCKRKDALASVIFMFSCS